MDGRLGLAGTARARSARRAQTLGLVEGWFRSQRGLAETLGEWAFYALAVLLILALSKRFPYHLFAKTHKLLAALYLVLVFHSLVLLTFDDWQQPMGWLLALLLAGGSVSALASLTGRIGRDRQVSGPGSGSGLFAGAAGTGHRGSPGRPLAGASGRPVCLCPLRSGR